MDYYYQRTDCNKSTRQTGHYEDGVGTYRLMRTCVCVSAAK